MREPTAGGLAGLVPVGWRAGACLERLGDNLRQVAWEVDAEGGGGELKAEGPWADERGLVEVGRAWRACWLLEEAGWRDAWAYGLG